MKEIACNRTIEYDAGFHNGYHKCGKKPHVKVTYKDGMRGDALIECLCKTHYNAFVKNATRINKKTGHDFNIQTEFI